MKKLITSIISLIFLANFVFAGIKVTPYGAAGIVSGSCFLVESGSDTIVIDCGLFMRDDSPEIGSDEKNSDIAQELIEAKTLILTHAHTDHCGRIPLLINKGFKGNIYCTQATKELTLALFKNRTGFENIDRKWFWSQSQRFNAERNNNSVVIHWTNACRASIKYLEESSGIMSLSAVKKEAGVNFYLCKDCCEWEADKVIAPFFIAKKYNEEIVLSDGLKFKFINAGHVPGSASVVLNAEDKTLVFSGDLGNGYSRLTGLFEVPQKADVLFMEATYADEKYKLGFEDYEIFRRDLMKAIKHGNIVWIPALAFNRTQKVLYEIYLMQKEGLIDKKIPVYSVSPTANALNSLYQKEADKKNGTWFLKEVYDGAIVVSKDVKQQMVREYDSQKILLSSSGDMDFGMSEKLANVLIPKKDVSIMIVNYVSPQSTAAKLLSGKSGASQIKNRAHAKKYDIFSDHPDFDAVCKWLENQEKSAKIYIIHSTAKTAEKMKKMLGKKGWNNVFITAEKQRIEI